MDVPSHYPHNMSPGELPYSQQPQQQSQQQQQQQRQPPSWQAAPHLLQPGHAQSYSTPSTPSHSLGEQQYNGYFQQGPPPQTIPEAMHMDRAHSGLSLNLSSLSVASPTNLSPINPSPMTSSATSGVSPITPISPSQGPNTPHTPFGAHHAQFHQQHTPNQFSFAPPDQGMRFDDQSHDLSARRIGLSSRSSSSSDKSVPRKRSFTAGTSLTTNVEETMYDPPSTAMDLSTPASYDEVDMGYPSVDPNGSPIDGSTSSEQDDHLRPLDSQIPSSSSHSLQAGSMGIIGKPVGTNNFVTKLYQMINDPKSTHFIAWTELGTSFVVSNVGEFSRSILGSHFKHNNFSSFVRQLNMYGFHKINRTPRAQRTSTDAQTWEFSHHKFLRGRPDLLDEIKRKALEPDPSIKHRVELPGEVAAQLSQMRDENRRVVNALAAEKAKFERLATLTKTMYDVVDKNFPGWPIFLHPRFFYVPSWNGRTVPAPFPADLIDPSESPNIYVTSPSLTVPSHSHSFASASAASLHSLSPGSSPTTADFPPHAHGHSQSHTHTPHSLSRQHSFQQQHGYEAHHMGHARYDTTPSSSALPPSPAPMDFEDAQGRKRQRTGGPPMGASVPGQGEVKRVSRARSDSAPLGYGFGNSWTTTRPRSGSGLAVRAPRRDEMVPSIGSVARAVGPAQGQQPMGSLVPLAKPSPSAP
ncbi:hypothetical protein BV25DRAFT_1703812 [Artomyces pyxidatus]|uniref:Uncharacterized protein n=1 Tax=Artomyces pyxidatus TaxID=48021 RepID=A0ACB8TAP2_9AGAM|nr:hypothetical protein BV25DRAFT_1703812 [Artomyces pyxidatus]